MQHSVQIGQHPHWQLLGLTFNADTLISLWIVTAVFLILVLVLRQSLKLFANQTPGLLQTAAELTVAGLKDLPESRMGQPGLKYFPLIGTLFLFILFCNWFELIPFSTLYGIFFENWLGALPHLAPPTSDLNVTVGLALLVFCAVHYYGVKVNGLKYFKHFLKPNFIFLPLNILEELARPFSLSIRLFGNIFAKEVILIILIGLLIFPVIYPVPILILSMLIGVIQAFIFALLATIYLEGAVGEGP